MCNLIHILSTSFLRSLVLTTGVLAAAQFVSAGAAAQVRPGIPEPSDTIYEVRLSDGTVTFARVTAVDRETVVLTTVAGGRLEIDRSHIVDLSPATGEVVNGQFWNEDPSGTRLFFSATGRTLREGQSYVGTYLIFLPFGAYGLTDRITIAAGAPVLFGEFEPFYLAPKVMIVERPTARVSLGTLAFFYDDEVVGIAYGVGTFGSADRAVSAGVGYFYSGDELSNEPAIMFAGETRVSRRIKLISENYILPERVGHILSGGIRIIGDRIATEVAVFGVVAEGGGGCCLPTVNFSYSFGK